MPPPIRGRANGSISAVSTPSIFFCCCWHCCRRATCTRVVAAVVWTLAFLAKQTIFPVALIMLCVDWKRPRRLLLGVGSFLLFTAVCNRLLDHATHGWFWFYAFTVPHANADLWLRPAVFYVPSQLIAPFGVALLFVAMAWVWTRPSITNFKTRFYLMAGVALLGLCWFLQAHAGATANTPMPAYCHSGSDLWNFIGSPGCCVGLRIPRDGAHFSAGGGGDPAGELGLQSARYYAAPRPGHSQEELISWLRVFPGDVFLPSNPYEGVLAGKQWHPDNAALHDALRPDLPGREQRGEGGNRRGNRSEVNSTRLCWTACRRIVLPSQPWLPADLVKRYPIVGVVPGSDVSDIFGPASRPIFCCHAGRRLWRLPMDGSCSKPADKAPAPLTNLPCR